MREHFTRRHEPRDRLPAARPENEGGLVASLVQVALAVSASGHCSRGEW
jgi:hypothetical protein